MWRGRPKTANAAPTLRVAGYVLIALTFISLCFAVVIARTLETPPTSSMIFAAWCSALAFVCLKGPQFWFDAVEYVITDTRVYWRRGLFSRSMDRTQVSFVRVFWDPARPGIGDLELVRAVPTGALRRRLRLRLHGVNAPARVAAIVLGRDDVTPATNEDRPLAQRLESGERVEWTGKPLPSARAYLPQTRQAWVKAFLFVMLVAVLARMVSGALPVVEKMAEAGLSYASLSFVALAAGLLTSAVVVAATAAYAFWDGVLQPRRQIEQTRYLVTNRRVLIQRGREELYLDRSRIAHVIDTPAGDGLFDVFLVLDGPQSRALAASGAFGEGERGRSLYPVLERVADAEGVRKVLGQAGKPTLPRAA
ncbi:MAG: hypothetical protein R3B13_28450 [Polyangiaceae bacterium]